MILKRIKIQNFRNIRRLMIEPDMVNVLYGPKKNKKTSVLEAISSLALGRSFRGSQTSHLINNESQELTISAQIERDNGNIIDSVGLMRSRSRVNTPTQISINGKHTNKLIDIVDKLCIQVIHPLGNELITGSPEGRRNFLDWGVYYSEPDFKEYWIKYKKIINQRNVLLKDRSNSFSKSVLTVWDDALASLSEKINSLRNIYLSELAPELEMITNKFLPNFKFHFELSKGWPNGVELKDLLALNFEKDRNLGYTFYGCHRAELKIKANKYPASETLSRGQSKLLVCAMRLAQGNVLAKQIHKNCIYLVDDINSELDQCSRELLIHEMLGCKNQIFITNINDDIMFPNDVNPNLINIQDQLKISQSQESIFSSVS